MDAYVDISLGALKTFTQLGGIIYTGNMLVSCMLVGMDWFIGGEHGILEKGVDPWMAQEHLDNFHGGLYLTYAILG